MSSWLFKYINYSKLIEMQRQEEVFGSVVNQTVERKDNSIQGKKPMVYKMLNSGRSHDRKK